MAKKIERLAIAFFYDEHGIVDDYMTFLLQSLQPFVSRIVFVSNGPLHRDSEAKVHQVADDVLIRENVGFDVWAYKHALEFVGFDRLAAYDEVILLNHTFYGPLFPFSEMFNAMDVRNCDFWGITSHQQMKPNPFTSEGILPFHLNSHFIVIRQPMLGSDAFRHYWKNIPVINNYFDSVLKHESKFTAHFKKLGYKVATYIDSDQYSTPYPVVMEVQLALMNRCPILKRRSFFHETGYFEENATDLQQALSVLRETSHYDEGLIWKNVVRSSQLRTLNINAVLMEILPDSSEIKKVKRSDATCGKLAVCAHVYHLDELQELLSYAENIPRRFDFIFTTDTDEKIKKIQTVAKKSKKISKIIGRQVAKNRGRDMSALFITCRDLFLDSEYEFVCRLHTKKSPQVGRNRGEAFKRHLLENLLASEVYVSNLLEFLSARPWIGVAIPPIVNFGFDAIGVSWYGNRGLAEEIADKLEMQVVFDTHTPVAPYGTMFWFRPPALKKLFKYEWKWEDFNVEPDHHDGGLAHALERMIAYAAQDARFLTYHIANPRSAARNYTTLESKLEALNAVSVSGSTRVRAHHLQRWKDQGHPFMPRSHFRIYRALCETSNVIEYPFKQAYRLARTIKAALWKQD